MIDLSRKPIYRFNDIEIDVPRGCVRVAGQEVYLRQQTFQVLLYLLKRRERLVTKEELFENIWKDAAVTDNALLQCIFDIRKVLGDDSRNPQFIKTFPKVGYRFICPVEEVYPGEEMGRSGKRGKGGIAEGETKGEADRVALSPSSYTAEPPSPGVAESPIPPVFPTPHPPRFSFDSLSPGRRVALVVAATVALVAAALVAIYVRQMSRTPKQTASEVILPQIADRQPLAVMYFDNQSGNPELDWLREGLADMLITDLSRSKNLVVLSRQQLHMLLERIGHKESEKIRLNEALEIARNARANIVILGSFAQLGQQIRIDVQLHNTRDAQLLAAERLIVDQPAQILTQVDLLSLKLASHLGAAPAEQDGNPSLTSVMTKDLEAYRYYSLAVEKAQALHNQEAIALFQRAITLDPQFAMAHARIGYAYAVTGAELEKGKRFLEKAFRLSDRLTEKDKLSIAAWYAVANQDYSAAIASFREIVSRYPLEVEAYWRLAILLRSEEHYEEALETAKQGLVVDPEAKDLYNALGAGYSELGRHEEAIAMFQRYVQLAPKEPNALDSLGLGYQWSGRYAEAITAYERALGLNPEFEVAVIHLGNTYFQQGRYRDALRQYQRYIQVVTSDFDRARGYGAVAIVHWRRGKRDEAERAAKTSWRYRKINSVPFLIALERGELTTAERLGKTNHEGDYVERGARGSLREFYYLRGRFAQKSSRGTEAVEHFKEALRHRPPIWNFDAYEDCLANAYLELGRLDEAIAEYERILRLNPNYPLVHYHLAQAFERKGQAEQARGAYQHFLEIWNIADADIPEVVFAKKQLSTHSER